ncbi:minichromosome maintenance protein MCM [archaeon]|nr:minichromosome maintenance protein MCM [archaeon]PJC45380.1 MAG: AAA family ATPase [Candidatus Pacearchaeota archaeon CG_4_9_14_0_2_um_filter_30_8]
MDEVDFTKEPEEGILEQKRPEQTGKQEELILESKRFIDSYKKELKSSLRDENNVVYVDFMEIAEESPMLSEELIKNPEEALRIIETAIEEMGLIENVRVRLFNLQKSDEILVRNIRSKHLNELILIEGIIRQSSDVRPQVVNAKFECPSCGTIISVLQIEKKFREPSRCSCGRRGGFKLLSKEMVDTQRLIVEEAPDMLQGGEQPKRINVFVKEDLVDPKMEERTTPGSRVKIIGILKEVPVPLSTGGMSTRFELALEVNNIIPMEETFEELDITEEDEQQIQELAADPKVREKLRDSIAPSVWGYEEIKESLLLQLFGGVQKQKPDGQKTRGDIHIMMIGDPGVAKSVILNFMANISPKGRYVVGKSTSGAGLTASVVRDEYLKGWSLEAGAMVLANKGLVAIDELEKMDPTDQSAMHEAMEQQTVTISKANVQATLRAQTSVLAAANPKFGRFDPSQGIPQQINLPPALINRFDIIFTMRDIPNLGNDTKVADHILEEHQREAKEMLVDKNLFRKYIAYARQRVQPKLTDEAVKKMKDFYVGLRNRPMIEGQEMRTIPISARQLNSLIRMAEATAKLRMSEKVEEEDAEIAINLLKYYLMQVGFDEETGEIDIDKISGKMKSSSRNKIFIVRDTISLLAKELGELIPIEKVEEKLEGKVNPEEIEDAIEKLAKEGTIFKPRRGYVQKL